MTGFLETLTSEIVQVLTGDVSYQIVIAFFLLPPAFLCLILLSIPLPSSLKRLVVRLMDAILFRKCKACGMKFTLYKWCLLVSLMSFVISWIDTEFNFSGTQVVVGSYRRGVGRMKNHEHALIILQDEKEWWVSLFTLTMYLVLDRFRKSVKHDLGMYQKEKTK